MTIIVIGWIIALVAFAGLEMATVSLVSIWFIGGAVAGLIAALCGGSIALQLVLFVVVSALLLALLRPLVKKYVSPKRTRTNADRLIGMEALVTEEICNVRETGAIKISGVVWTARSVDDTVIPAGTLVKILRIEGAKMFVEPAAVPAATK